MPINVKITCDDCGNDLTTTGNSEDYRLCLKPEAIPSSGGIVTDLAAHPPIDKAAYFCDIPCFLRWVKKKYG